MRSTVGFRHPVAGEQITHGTDPLRGTPSFPEPGPAPRPGRPGRTGTPPLGSDDQAGGGRARKLGIDGDTRSALERIDRHTVAIEEITARIEVVIEPFQGFRDLICSIAGLPSDC